MAESGAPAWRSGAFRAAATAIALLVLTATLISSLLLRQAQSALTDEIVQSLRRDADVMTRESEKEGVPALRAAVERRAAVGGGLYLLAGPDGAKLAGNLDRLPAEIAAREEGGVFSYALPGQAGGDARQAVGVRRAVPGVGLLVVAQDVERQQRLLARMRYIGLAGMVLLAVAGLSGGYMLSRNVVARVDAVNRTARDIMAGDMSRRVPLSGQGDEIDALSANLNHMLDRIGQLMAGLREVSDNIAHDLKTPLNRMRNRAEAALREGRGEAAYKEGLERTIEDADQLIKTFNALLLIARLEAGALEGTTEKVDLAALIGDVVELYEPVAEEAGLVLAFRCERRPQLDVNRHLVSQAMANLVDNAIKYGTTGAGAAAPGSRRASRIDVGIETRAGFVDLIVADDGPGIGAADRKRALERFVRLEQSRSQPGTGLGLSLVAAVARLHGGSVSLGDNAPGLRVVLSLPDKPRDAIG